MPAALGMYELVPEVVAGDHECGVGLHEPEEPGSVGFTTALTFSISASFRSRQLLDEDAMSQP